MRASSGLRFRGMQRFANSSRLEIANHWSPRLHRNPLNGIMGSLSLMNERTGSGEAAWTEGDDLQVLSTASMCCLQLRRTLDDVLDLDKITAVGSE